MRRTIWGCRQVGGVLPEYLGDEPLLAFLRA